jgi:transaldolase
MARIRRKSLKWRSSPGFSGFTTNPSLMKAAQVSDYVNPIARDLVAAVPDRHISFEVFSDDIPEMVAQARVISAWGANVYAKLPVTTTRGEPLFKAVRALSHDGIKVNLTAVFTAEQARTGSKRWPGGAPACVSVFAGRLADAGIDYRPIMRDAVARARQTTNVEIIWASTREVFNVIEADEMRLPHHHGACGGAQKASGAWNQNGGGAVARCGQGVPRGCRIRGTEPAARGVTGGRVSGLPPTG